jgi:diguanylate cyclase (GGDEF)-like protein
LLLDALIVAMGISATMWLTEFGRDAVVTSLPIWQQVTLLGYLVCDVGTFVLVCLLLVMARKRPFSLFALLSYPAFSLIADTGMLHARFEGGQVSGITIFAQIMVWNSVALAVSHPSFKDVVRLSIVRRRSGHLRVVALTIVAIGPSLVGLRREVDPYFCLAISAAMALLLSVRSGSLITDGERSIARTMDVMSEGAYDLMAVVDRDGITLDLSSVSARLLNLNASEPFERACHPEDVARFRAAIAHATLATHEQESLEVRLMISGQPKYFRVIISDRLADVDVAGLVINAHNIDALRRLATLDALTGLPNRSALLKLLTLHLAAGARVTTLLIDLDDFKDVNDSFGHAAGDAVLAISAQRMEALLSAQHHQWVARLGGDEFVAVLLHVDDKFADAMAEKILAALREPVCVQGMSFTLGASIGIRSLQTTGCAEDALRDADIALYEAKRSGRGRAVRFAASMAGDLHDKMSMRVDLDHAMAEKEFSLVYQPKVRVSDGRLVGVEALLRWRRENGEQISPVRFVPVAEETGQIVAIGDWVLGEALSQLSRWDALLGNTPLRMAVNVSPRQLREVNFADRVATLLSEHNISPSRLILELTETALMTNPETSASLLAKGRALGVHISIDDYGSGNASISYLRNLSPDEVKIDRSLTDGLRTSEPSAIALVRLIIEVARALRLTVVAEGVEDDSQLGVLKDLGCDIAQGYAIARPLEPERATRYVCEHPPYKNSTLPPRVSVEEAVIAKHQN